MPRLTPVGANPFVSKGLLDSIAQTESSGNSNAVSPVGAQGLFQFMPATAKQYGVKNPFDPVQARQGAEKYLTDLSIKYGGSLPHTLAAWNWGPGNVDRKGLDKAPKETRDFIARVKKQLFGLSPIKSAAASERPGAAKLTAVEGNPFAVQEQPAAAMEQPGAKLTAVEGNPFAEAGIDPASLKPQKPGSLVDSLKYGFATPEARKRLNPDNGAVGSFLQGVGDAPEFAGALVGGTAGAALGAVGGGVGALPGGVAGAALGGAAGHNAKQLVGNLLGVRQGATNASEAGDVLKSGVYNATGEAGGRVLAKGAQKIMAPMAHRISDQTRHLMNVAKARGIDILPGDATNSPTLRGIQSVLRKAPISAGQFAKLDEANQAGMVKWGDDITRQAGGRLPLDAAGERIRDAAKGMEEFAQGGANKAADVMRSSVDTVKTGSAAKDAIIKSRDAWRENMNRQYDELGQAAGDARIPANAYKATMKRLTAEADAAAPFIKGKALPIPRTREAALVDPQGRPLHLPPEIAAKVQAKMGDTSGVPDAMDWKTYQAVRSQLNDLTRSNQMIGDISGAKAVQLRKALDTDAQKWAEATGGDVLAKKQALDTEYKAGKQLFNDSIIGRLGNETFNPENVIKTLIKPGAITDIQRARKVMGPAFGSIEDTFKTQLIDASTKEGNFHPALLKAQIQRYGEPTIREVLGPKADDLAQLIQKGEMNLSKLTPQMRDLAKGNGNATSVLDQAAPAKNPLRVAKNLKAGGRDFADTVKRARLTDILERATINDPVADAPSGISAAKLNQAMQRHGDAALSLQLGDSLPDLKQMGGVGELLRDRLGDSGTATRAGYWGAAAPIGLLAGYGITGNETMKDAAIASSVGMGGTAIAGKFLTSPAGRKWLTEGYKLMPLGEAIYRATGLQIGQASE